MEDILARSHDIALFGAGIGTYMLRGYIADQIMRQGRKMINKSQRNSLVYHHTYNQELGRGHTTPSPFDCTDGNCGKYNRQPALQLV